MHDGHFVQVDPWQHVSLLETITKSIFWDIYPSVIFYTGVGALVACLDLLPSTNYGIHLPSTMLTVLGTVIGFVVSYRCHSAYARYLEGSQLWGELIHLSRSFGRHIWFHVPNQVEEAPLHEPIPDKDQAQALIEKKTIINLIEAHAFAVKHYLRGEPGSYYEDVYPHVACLPRYAMPISIPERGTYVEPHIGSLHIAQVFGDSFGHHPQPKPDPSRAEKPGTNHMGHGGKHAHYTDETHQSTASPSNHHYAKAHTLPQDLLRSPSGSAPSLDRTNTAPPIAQTAATNHHVPASRPSSWSGSTVTSRFGANFSGDVRQRPSGELLKPLHVHSNNTRHRHDLPSPPPLHGPRNPPTPLMPARLPPPFNFFDDIAPFLEPIRKCYRWIRARTESQEQKLRRIRKQRKHALHEDNLPLEIQLYFASYMSTLEKRRILSVPVMASMLRNLEDFEKNLSHLEKIVTTPIPFAYSVHLKHSTMLYLAFLPFQLERYLGWVTIPAMFIASFMFLGFLGVAAQIEGPFGYDTNDLDLDSMCSSVVAKELREMTSRPPAGPDDYIFSQANEPFFPSDKRTARQLAQHNVSRAEVEHILLQGHKHDLGLRSQRAHHRNRKDKSASSTTPDLSGATYPSNQAGAIV